MARDRKERNRDFRALLDNLDTPSKPYVRAPSFFRFTPAESARYTTSGRRRLILTFLGVMALPPILVAAIARPETFGILIAVGACLVVTVANCSRTRGRGKKRQRRD